MVCKRASVLGFSFRTVRQVAHSNTRPTPNQQQSFGNGMQKQKYTIGRCWNMLHHLQRWTESHLDGASDFSRHVISKWLLGLTKSYPLVMVQDCGSTGTPLTTSPQVGLPWFTPGTVPVSWEMCVITGPLTELANWQKDWNYALGLTVPFLFASSEQGLYTFFREREREWVLHNIACKLPDHQAASTPPPLQTELQQQWSENN